MPLLSKEKKEAKKVELPQENIDSKINPTNLDFLNLGNKAIIK